MTSSQKKRLWMILFIFSGLSLTLVLCLYALKKNINLYYTPSQLMTESISTQQKIRVGGLVKSGSFKRNKETLEVNFEITDLKHELKVAYTGVLPDLFKEGQGVVVLGFLSPQKTFLAEEVLAKHDEKYMPSEVRLALEKAAAYRKNPS